VVSLKTSSAGLFRLQSLEVEVIRGDYLTHLCSISSARIIWRLYCSNRCSKLSIWSDFMTVRSAAGHEILPWKIYYYREYTKRS
jgi:hypothetical protein